MESQDPKAGEVPLAELTGVQFGILNMEETVTFSVFERHHSINTAKDLWDGRLGIYNLSGNDNHCTTCGARKASECDGHFGHINLPMPIYHPLHIRFLKNVLSHICLVCHRSKKRKEVKKGTFEEKATWMEIKRQLENAESLDSESDCEIVVSEKPFILEAKCNIEALNREEVAFKSTWAQVSEKLASKTQSLGTLRKGLRSTDVAAQISSKDCVLPSLTESADNDFPRCGATQRTSNKPEHLESKHFTNSKLENYLVEELDSSESSDDEEGCKYCGAKIKKSEDRYPNLIVTLCKKKENSYETIEMKACVKKEKVPQDYWTFVGGHPEGCDRNMRPLLPIEAFKILQSLSDKVIRKLGMNECVARPEALVLWNLPVPPSGSRIAEMDFGSYLPRTHTDKQHMLLQRLSSEVKRLQSSRIGKPKFAAAKNEVMELQILASDYLTGSKWENGLKYKAYSAVKRDVEKDDKYMKSILAKTNDSSARMVVVGDPSIKIEEISLPLFLVEQLTVPEKVTTFNTNRLQQYVDNGPYADLYKTGAVHIDRPGRGRVRLHSRLARMTLEVGDTVHRHIKDGDLVIVNRTPTLTKHSLLAMQVRLHLGCSLAINPLICGSFQADFDGDCMHIYVPQSPESLAELHGLMRVSNQLINSQGGQSNNAMAEDSRLGAYLISSSCLFLDKTEMSQLTSSSLSSLPVPAILKSPKGIEPLWTGQQLFSTVIPEGICYRASDMKFKTDVKRGILIRDGELLVCDGSSIWLGNAPDALTAVISKIQGPAAALAYLNQAQELANMYIRNRGFSVGLQDFQLTRNRSPLFRRRLEEVSRGNREALMHTLLKDQNVQREELKNNPTSQRGLSAETECSKSKGLFLGSTGIAKRATPLDKVAINWFQTKYGQTTNRLAKDYCKKTNPLLLMINAGSKGSMSKLVQQTISLGLQLYKGEYLLPWSVQDLFYQRELTDISSLRAKDLLQFKKPSPQVDLSGYWESRGIITSSYLDGLSPLQFFTHNIASRYGMLRAKVEEPNLLLKRLLLFLRNLHMGYDGSVRSSEGQHIVQFEYGGLLEMESQDCTFTAVKGPTEWCEAGEAVGILAATAITEPAYQLKLDSPHNVGAKAIGPLDLIQETLSSRKVFTIVDRRILLRMPLALRNRRYGQEKGASRIQQHLKPVTLAMVTSATMIEYRKTQIEVGRNSPWVGHIRLDVEKLKIHQVLVKELLTSLEKKLGEKCKFFSSDRCHFGSTKTSQEEPEPCIHFFVNIASAAALDDKQYDENLSCLLETMKDTLLPILLCSVLKGDERIESVTLLWEDMDWTPRCAKNPSRNSCKLESGELVVEVTVKQNYCKVRGKAWEIAKEACIPIMPLVDWQRSSPYSIKELNHVFGLEAAKGVLLQRLELAVAGMGKVVNLEHLELIADSMVTSGEVNGATLSGYKRLCKTISRPAPFSLATFQNSKSSFISAGEHGACETIEGALASSVWGKAPCLGTGSSFRILWQAKAGEEPAQKIQQGVDIHQCIAKLNSLTPTGSCIADPVLRCPSESQNRHAPEKFRYRMRPLSRHVDSYSHDVDDDGRRITRSTSKMEKIGDRRHVKSDVPSAPSKALTKPKMARTEVITGDEGNYGLRRGSKPLHRGYLHSNRRGERNSKFSKDSRPRTLKASSDTFQASRGRGTGRGAGHQDIVTSQVGINRASDDGSNCRQQQLSDDAGQVGNRRSALERQDRSSIHVSHPPVALPTSSEELALNNFGTEAPEDSSSFHTPNETLEPHSANSSPCSSFREDLHPPQFLENNVSEGDQMSGISQPPLQTSALIDKLVGVDSCPITQRVWRVEPCELQGVEGCGSMSSLGERSTRKINSGQHSSFTIETIRLSASEDALERRKEELNDEWERLLKLSRQVKFILNRKYKAGERLKGMDQTLIMEKVLRFHPEYTQKVGCGVHYIKVDYHQNYKSSLCFFVVRVDKSVCDFSYHKCIKSVANAKSPALALQYDHEVIIKNERNNCSDNIDLPDSLDFDTLNLYSSWSPLHKHDQLGCDLTPPEMKPDYVGCNESKLSDFKPKEESSCETSELKPGP